MELQQPTEKTLLALRNVQATLNAPKNKRNTFGNYSYRSCEDILEAVKPLLKINNSTLLLSDEIVPINGDTYIKATATFVCDSAVSVTAWAREEKMKKGMDAAQMTGACSSYARKYALNGLFAIDDNKDPDTEEYQQQAQPQQAPKPQPKQDNRTPEEKFIAAKKKIQEAATATELATIWVYAEKMGKDFTDILRPWYEQRKEQLTTK